jgi:hypothetical protein
MNDILSGLLKNVAPGLATAVMGPMGGMAVKAIASKLGIEDTVEAVTAHLQANPDAALKLRELDLKELELNNANTDSARKMNAEVQNSANASWLAKNIAYCIDVVIVTSTIGLTYMLMSQQVPADNKELALMAFGSLVTLCGTVVNFHRGSSQGSKDKSKGS